MSEEELEENQKLESLEVQIGEMKNDFEEMKKVREEDNKQFGEKLGDIYLKLADHKTAQEAETTRVNNLIKSLESKLDLSLNKIKDHI